MAAEKPPPPKNGVYIVQGEMLLVVTAMRRSSKWTSHLPQEEEQDPLLNSFSQLRDILNNISDLSEIEPNIFLGPFLDVIRSEDTTGPITGLALSSINKFLSYGLLEPNVEEVASGIENIADAVTHARFVGTDPGSDEVVLMKILQVLRTLLLTPVGAFLSNESVCEIMQSCFRICFEMRLSELLRRSAEHTLVDMVQLLFARLPHFREEKITGLRRLKMRAGGISEQSRRKHPRHSPKSLKRRERQNSAHLADEKDRDGDSLQSVSSQGSTNPNVTQGETQSHDTSAIQDSENSNLPIQGPGHGESQDSLNTNPDEKVESMDGDGEMEAGEGRTENEQAGSPTTSVDNNDENVVKQERPDKLDFSQGMTQEEELETPGMETPQETHLISMQVDQRDEEGKLDPESISEEQRDPHYDGMEEGESGTEHSDSASVQDSEYVNTQGVRFTPQQHIRHGSGPPVPYGLPCVRELFRFLISLINPYDKHNIEVMTHMGLSLLTIALETGCDHICASPSLLSLVKDDMCKNLFALLQTERLSVFASTLRVGFMLFESMRTHLKFQLEMYLHKLTDIIISETPRIPYEQREMALDSLVQLWRIPSLVSELYINYDCDIFSSSLFEDLTKLLSKNAFPVSGSLYTTHLLSLDALLAVIDSIEANTQHRILNSITSSDEKDPGVDSDSGIRVHMDGEVEGRERTDSDVRRITFVSPPTTGYGMAQSISSVLREKQDYKLVVEDDKIIIPVVRRVSRYRPSGSLPTSEEIAALKHRKKIVGTGADLFNQKPSKGIAYLQEKGILKTPTDYFEVAQLIRECPHLEKQQIGDYISAKKNVKVIEAFMRTFQFENTRIDEALRMYLETFRLPGEAPVIQHIMEHFSDHWHSCNNFPFAHNDAAFTLAYAVIMLNVDQHNCNAKKQNIPMTPADFKKNLKYVNGGSDFDPAMLEEIYNAIKNEEIVMPAEQTGLVKENYLWRVLLKRGHTPEGKFLHTGPGMYDKDLFLLTWGATVAALSFVFDKSVEDAIMQKTLAGFRKCAMISAHYGLTDVFDNLVISLCKFSTLQKNESPETLPVSFGTNMKAQMAAKTVFSLAHRHGDILSDGWKNLLDCMLQLFRSKLLPPEMVEVQDFVDPKGKVSLIREEMPAVKSDSSLLGSFYSYFSMNTEVSQAKILTPEDREAKDNAKSCIEDCHPELLITESKFLRLESLNELVKALSFASQGPQAAEEMGNTYDEEASVFNVELLIRLVLENRDRVSAVWQSVCDHFYTLIVTPSECSFLVERTVVGLIRIAIRLLRKEDIAGQVLSSLKMLLMMKVSVLHHVSRQIACGLHELLKLNAANIHSSEDWYTLFTLLEVVGAGADPPAMMRVTLDEGSEEVETDVDTGAQSDSELAIVNHGPPETDQGYTSDSELYKRGSGYRSGSESETSSVSSGSGWLVVNKDGKMEQQNQFEITLDNKITFHDTKALSKSCETLAFLVRDAAHVTPANFESCVHAIRTFVEATVNGGKLKHEQRKQKHADRERDRKKRSKSKSALPKAKSVPEAMSQMSEIIEDTDGNGHPGGYQALSIQLLDLMHTLHTRAASIFSSWAEEEQRDGQASTIDAGTSALWVKCWCPLLQGIARLCCDTRRQVRMQALTYLQRALLVHDLQTLSALEWESCFNKVLFPLLSKLLESNIHNPMEMEETRMRASNLLCKGFLQHLAPLLSLSTFTALWLTILDFMDKYMHADKSELLSEAIPESLKNMLLVMDTAGVFQMDDTKGSLDDPKGSLDDPAYLLWMHTWERINCFLPGLKDEVFKPQEPARFPASVPSQDAIPRDVGEPRVNGEKVSQKDKKNGDADKPPKPGTEAPAQKVDKVPVKSNSTTQHAPITSPPSKAGVQHAKSKVPSKKSTKSSAHVPVSVTHIAPQSTFILHPPLPSLVPPGQDGSIRQGGTVPLIIDPRVLQGTQLPIITVTQAQTAGSGT